MRIVRRAILAVVLIVLAACGQTTSVDTSRSQSTASTSNAAVSSVFCDEIGRRVAQADCDDMVRVAKGAETGEAAFNAPGPMRRGDGATLQLAISYAPEETPDTATDTAVTTNTTTTTGVDSAHPTPAQTVGVLPGETHAFTPLVGRFMHAELTGAGFDIRALSPAQQEVTRDGVTTWTWSVKARQGGEQPLTLTTVVVGCLQGGECIPLRTTTHNYTVKVHISTIDTIRDTLMALPDWIKLITAVLVALTALITAWFGLRRAFRRGNADA